VTSWSSDHPGFEVAVQAILDGDLPAMTASLDAAPDLVTARGAPPVGATLLHITAFNGFEALCFPTPAAMPAIARLLIERGAEPDATTFDSPSGTPLCWNLSSWWPCAAGLQCDMADAYLDGGAAIDGVSNDGAPIGHAIGFGYTRAVEHMARRGARTDYLTAAAALGALDRLRPWRRADGTFADEAMNFAQHPEKTERDRFSWPPPRNPEPNALALVTAATHGRAEVVDWLLQSGVDPNRAVSFDQTALHFAATHRSQNGAHGGNR
jgi:hypothetical protein